MRVFRDSLINTCCITFPLTDHLKPHALINTNIRCCYCCCMLSSSVIHHVYMPKMYTLGQTAQAGSQQTENIHGVQYIWPLIYLLPI